MNLYGKIGDEKLPNRMVVVKLNGGLGNQMFQYAAARALALNAGQRVCLDISEFETYKLHNYGLDQFQIISKKYKKPNTNPWSRLRDKFKTSIFYKERDFSFDPEVLNLTAHNIFLEGYFQSEKYFSNYASSVRQDFSFKGPFKNQTVQMLDLIQKKESVSVHFRRGDYVNNPVHGIDLHTYYEDAIRDIGKLVSDPVFFVFSDDIEWIKQNFIFEREVYYIDFNNASTNFEDLKLMSACKHNIIANSSFSWWGAWLNSNSDKLVIAPKKWFNDPSINSIDLIPPEWIAL